MTYDLTEDEYQVILELEKTLGIRKTDLVRGQLLQDAPFAVVNAKELISILNGLGAEMGRCGNNINQMAKYTNILKMKRVLSPVVIERFNLLFEQYRQSTGTGNHPEKNLSDCRKIIS